MSLPKVAIIFTYVSTIQQETELPKQTQRLVSYRVSSGLSYDIITALGSSDRDLKLREILNRVENQTVSHIVITNKDRLSRQYDQYKKIENICINNKVELVVLDTSTFFDNYLDTFKIKLI